jgi:DNA-binding NarL/FixJ family response regulator
MPKSIDRNSAPPAKSFVALARDDDLGAEVRANRAPKILVVEDDFLVATEMEVALQIAGFVVTGVAASADEAIALARSTSPDLAIVDIRLYGPRDGVDAALVMFRDHAIRCIFATAHADAAVRNRAAPAAPLGWLQKPYSMPLLIDTVRQALAQKRT